MMEISEKELGRLIREAMENEADYIMKKVNSVPELQDMVAPDEIHDKLFEQIRKHEESK